MFKRLFLIPAVLSSLLMLSGSAFAQHRGSGRSAPARSAPAAHRAAPAANRGAVVNRGVVARAGTFNRGYAGNGNYANYGGRNFNNRGYYGGGYYGAYWPGYYGGYNNWGYLANDYAYPNAGYPYAPPVVPQATMQIGYIRVFLPDPQAQIWVNGQLTRQTGTDRMFSTPPIAAGATYQIRVGWMEGDNETTSDRTVTVTPGATSVVDFTGNSAE